MWHLRPTHATLSVSKEHFEVFVQTGGIQKGLKNYFKKKQKKMKNISLIKYYIKERQLPLFLICLITKMHYASGCQVGLHDYS